MFDRERFVDDIRQIQEIGAGDQKAVQEIMKKALEDPGAVIKSLGEPQRAGADILYKSEKLTIINAVWGASMSIWPHNHEMWATIGIYTGGEDNVFWRRIADSKDGCVEAAGAKELRAGDVTSLGKDIIHSVLNPIPRLTGAIHVYGGDFFTQPRSEWDSETLVESTYNVEKTLKLFEDANGVQKAS